MPVFSALDATTSRTKRRQTAKEAVQFLCHAFEGNLLGAAQELEKLALLNLPQPLGLLALQNVTGRTDFTPFQLIDTLLEGKVRIEPSACCCRLRGEGVEASACWSGAG